MCKTSNFVCYHLSTITHREVNEPSPRLLESFATKCYSSDRLITDRNDLKIYSHTKRKTNSTFFC